MKKYTGIFLSVLLIVTLAACGSAPTENSAPLPPPLVEEQIVPSPVTNVSTQSITLLAAGDNLIHDVIYKQARARATDGKYDFIPAYSAVMPIIQAADIAVINQETILASDVAEVSSYPCFCSPTELGEQLLEIGFDVFTQANNHSYDKGSAGIRACMDFWDKHPKALSVGIYRDAA
ncbi:MAG: CapA family protein, partial [Angelakisella sp.]